jgi:hypothetical protein
MLCTVPKKLFLIFENKISFSLHYCILRKKNYTRITTNQVQPSLPKVVHSHEPIIKIFNLHWKRDMKRR